MNKLVTNKPIVVDKKLAVILGLKEAIVLQQINYWLEINKKKNNNYCEGRYWTYNTLNEWQEEFPFWSLETVKRIFKKLRAKNLIITNNFNKMKTDRTLWYSINYEELERINNENKQDDGMSKRVKSDRDNTSVNNEIKDKKQNDTMHEIENDTIDNSSLISPIPEITTETSTNITTDISNHSVSRIYKNIKNEENKEVKETKYNFLEKYRQVIDKCELNRIEDNYCGAVRQAIMVLLIETNNGQSVKIGNNLIPGEIIRRDIDKIDPFVIEHAIKVFKEASCNKKIKKSISYLKDCIYNSLIEIKLG